MTKTDAINQLLDKAEELKEEEIIAVGAILKQMPLPAQIVDRGCQKAYVCPICGTDLEWKSNRYGSRELLECEYCPECGQRVEYD